MQAADCFMPCPCTDRPRRRNDPMQAAYRHSDLPQGPEDNCYYVGWQFIKDSVKVILGLP